MAPSLRGWHIVCAGLIWLASAILTFMNLLSTIWLGVVFIVLSLVTISIGMLKIVKFERYEKVNRKTNHTTGADVGRQMTTTAVNASHPYNTFANEPDVSGETENQEVLDPNDPNIRFSKKYQGQFKV